MSSQPSYPLVEVGWSPGLKHVLDVESGRPLCEVDWLRVHAASAAGGSLRDAGTGTPTCAFCAGLLEKSAPG
jgi:hypothetical protein